MAVLFLALFLALAFLAAILSTSLLEWAGDRVILPCALSFSKASAAAGANRQSQQHHQAPRQLRPSCAA